MSEAQEEGLAPVLDDEPQVQQAAKEPSEIEPVVFFDKDDLFDFRPVQIGNDWPEEPAPKDSSAPESADSSEESSQEVPEETVPAEKANGQPKANESGKPTSSKPTPAGKDKQTAST